MQHGKMGAMAGRVHELHQQPPGEALQWRLTGVGRAQLECRDPEAVTLLFDQMHHEPLIAKDGEQVIDTRPGQVEVAGNGGGRHRFGVSCQ